MLPGLTGVGLQSDGVCVVRVERATGRPPALTLVDFRPWGDQGQEKVLERVAHDYDLGRSRCTTVLDANEYSLLLTEAPDVPPDELRAAIRWRIKDLIDFHINDATLDVFDLPGEKAAGRARSMYAVAARSSAIQKRADMMSAAGINLDVIDIPEMAQRNLAALLPEDARGVALLSFTSGGGLITISKQSEIYLSRNIDIGLEMMTSFQDANELFDRIVLEMQRSLDYYDSHFRQAPITTIALAPMPREVPGLLDYLKANLSASVITMDLTKLLECEADLKPELQSACLNVLGAALRQEERAL
ncbi:agglutinin biogenesis protein MshI [Sulfuricaulis limicola]|uniref:Agglutinin biogenesis protein MshI n=1 Tax=Sulfuricaulis limicola TaxID=1620215 RepID=A0A1B4XD20_9GAMM|nr:pilus assembly protein PilM [Sulfuricaulis limicola]BAV32713.1 agglutinin biogenesis protein MshI [Sulfuricaulis limicola]